MDGWMKGEVIVEWLHCWECALKYCNPLKMLKIKLCIYKLQTIFVKVILHLSIAMCIMLFAKMKVF